MRADGVVAPAEASTAFDPNIGVGQWVEVELLGSAAVVEPTLEGFPSQVLQELPNAVGPRRGLRRIEPWFNRISPP